MILVESIIEKDSKRYIEVRIHTACCKSLFIVEDQGKELFNPVTNEYLPKGMVTSIRQAEKFYEQKQS